MKEPRHNAVTALGRTTRRQVIERAKYHRWNLRYYKFLVGQCLFGKYIYIHINKCGGTSIEAALGIPLKIHDTALERRRRIGPYRWGRAFKFSVVRHPYSRAISMYKYRVRMNTTGLGSDPVPLNEWVRRAYRDREPAFYDSERWFQPCSAWLSDERDNSMVDFVARLESIKTDWPLIQAHIGTVTALPHANATHGKVDWEMLDRGARRILDAQFQSDFVNFGYNPS